MRDRWEPVVEKASMQECKDFIKGHGFLDEKGNPLKFVWHPTRPGDGVRTCLFMCKSHVDCPVLVKGARMGGTFWVQTLAGVQHASEVAQKGRKNSALTTSQRDTVRTLVDVGTKPAAILSALTSAELERCKAANEKPLKRSTGGLTGAYAAERERNRPEYVGIHEYTANTLQIHFKYIHKIHKIHIHNTYAIHVEYM